MKEASTRRLIILAVMLTMPLMGMGMDMYVPSLPAITQFFQISDTIVKLSVSLYLMSYGLMQLIGGFLVERYGRRRLFIGGTALFIVASLGLSMATSIGMLLWMRLLQGVGLALPAVAARAMIIDTFTGKERASYSNYMAICWSLGAILSPVVGAYLQWHFNWQAVFYAMSIYAGLVVVLMIIGVPETMAQRDGVDFKADVKLFSTMLSNGSFLHALAVMTLAYAVMIMFHVVGPFLIQNIMHHSVTTYGYLSLGLGVFWLLGSLANRIMMRSGLSSEQNVQVASVGFLLFAVGLLFDAPLELSLLTLMIPIYGMTFCGAIIFVNSLTKAMSLFQHGGGMVSAIMGAFAMLGVSVSSLFASLIKAQTQVPLSIVYLLMALLIVVLVRPRRQAIKLVPHP